MFRLARPFSSLTLGATVLCFLGASSASAYRPIVTANQVTNTKNGRNERPALDKTGQTVVFVSNSDHVAGVAMPPTGAFDFDGQGNAFATGSPPSPSCANCTAADSSAGNLYLWRLKKKGSTPANSVTQLTFSSAGGFDANEYPDMDSKAGWVAWNSTQDHTGGNADGNSEIFLLEVDGGAITQLTSTTSGGSTANRTATISDKGRIVAFDSTRDFAAVPTCKRPDGVTPCGNADGNAEIMFLDRQTGALTQVTSTTGDGNDAQANPRISVDGEFLVFQSTRDFAGPLSGGVTCVGLDGLAACGNDGNAEIYVYDLEERRLVQVTDTVQQAGCSGKSSSQRPEVAKKGKYLVFESQCEEQLNPTGCGACDDNDEAFFVDMKKGEIVQLTISDGGWNRVPRISDTGKYIAFDSNRNYLGLNSGHNETLFILKRSSTKMRPGETSKSQVEEDPVLQAQGIFQNPKTQISTIQFTGGFPASERIGVSGNGRFFAFESSKDVGNQEIWLVDRNQCTHGFPDCF